jgi:hypothetical protein
MPAVSSPQPALVVVDSSHTRAFGRHCSNGFDEIREIIPCLSLSSPQFYISSGLIRSGIYAL